MDSFLQSSLNTFYKVLYHISYVLQVKIMAKNRNILHKITIQFQKKGAANKYAAPLNFQTLLFQIQPAILCLFYRTGNTFCKLFLQYEEYNHSRDGTEQYAAHQHTIIGHISGDQVGDQHRHCDGFVICHDYLWP